MAHSTDLLPRKTTEASVTFRVAEEELNLRRRLKMIIIQ